MKQINLKLTTKNLKKCLNTPKLISKETQNLAKSLKTKIKPLKIQWINWKVTKNNLKQKENLKIQKSKN